MGIRASIQQARTSTSAAEGDARTYCFEFSDQDEVFAGHFPGWPLLPGYIQIEIARMVAEWELGHPLKIKEITRSKFRQPITPDQPVEVRIKIKTGDDRYRVKTTMTVCGNLMSEVGLVLARS